MDCFIWRWNSMTMAGITTFADISDISPAKVNTCIFYFSQCFWSNTTASDINYILLHYLHPSKSNVFLFFFGYSLLKTGMPSLVSNGIPVL